MNGHLTSITLNTGDTLWTLRKQNPRLLPTRIGLGGLNMSLTEPPSVPPKGGKPRAATRVSPPLQGGLRGALTNILSHSTAGQYGYGAAKPYAFNDLLTASPLIPAREQHISFNAMQQPDTISEGGYTAAFSYYGDMGRASMAVTDSLGHMVETRTYYDQQYNEFTRINGNTTQTKRILWLGGTPYNAPVAIIKDYGESDWKLVHVLRDNLGSITNVVDTAGTVLQELSCSAWGLLRDPQTLEPYGPEAQPELLLGRGYTGHEHLPWFGLVNMNARLYDPAVGRFLSPDPLIKAPDNTQNYNRYSYCLNNPLRYVDSNGMMHYDEELGYVFDKVVIYAFPAYNPFPNFTIGWDDKPMDMRSLFNARYNNLLYSTPISNAELSGYIDMGNIYNVANSNGLSGTRRYASVSSSTLSYLSKVFEDSEMKFAFVKENGWEVHYSDKVKGKGNNIKIDGFKAYRVSSLGKWIGGAGAVIGLSIIYSEFNEAGDALERNDDEEAMRLGLDGIVDAVGLIPHWGTIGFNIVWNMGLNNLFWDGVHYYNANIVLPQYHNGVLGYPSTMPFK